MSPSNIGLRKDNNSLKLRHQKSSRGINYIKNGTATWNYSQNASVLPRCIHCLTNTHIENVYLPRW